MPLISRKEAAEQLGVTLQSVYMSIKRGKLTAMEDAKGNILINSDTMWDELKKKAAGPRVSKVGTNKPRNSRTNESIPEADLCNHLSIKLVDGLGDKINSSSWLLNDHK